MYIIIIIIIIIRVLSKSKSLNQIIHPPAISFSPLKEKEKTERLNRKEDEINVLMALGAFMDGDRGPRRSRRARPPFGTAVYKTVKALLQHMDSKRCFCSSLWHWPYSSAWFIDCKMWSLENLVEPWKFKSRLPNFEQSQSDINYYAYNTNYNWERRLVVVLELEVYFVSIFIHSWFRA